MSLKYIPKAVWALSELVTHSSSKAVPILPWSSLLEGSCLSSTDNEIQKDVINIVHCANRLSMVNVVMNKNKPSSTSAPPRWRTDGPPINSQQQTVLRNAKSNARGYFKVPRVVIEE